MTGFLLVLGILVLVWFILVWIGSLAHTPRPPLAHIEHCPYYGHKMILYPMIQDRLSCMFCPYDMPLPRGAPQEPAERTKWAKRHGLLPGQSGRSAAFLETLERAE